MPPVGPVSSPCGAAAIQPDRAVSTTASSHTASRARPIRVQPLLHPQGRARAPPAWPLLRPAYALRDFVPPNRRPRRGRITAQHGQQDARSSDRRERPATRRRVPSARSRADPPDCATPAAVRRFRAAHHNLRAARSSAGRGCHVHRYAARIRSTLTGCTGQPGGFAHSRDQGPAGPDSRQLFCATGQDAGMDTRRGTAATGCQQHMGSLGQPIPAGRLPIRIDDPEHPAWLLAPSCAPHQGRNTRCSLHPSADAPPSV